MLTGIADLNNKDAPQQVNPPGASSPTPSISELLHYLYILTLFLFANILFSQIFCINEPGLHGPCWYLNERVLCDNLDHDFGTIIPFFSSCKIIIPLK